MLGPKTDDRQGVAELLGVAAHGGELCRRLRQWDSRALSRGRIRLDARALEWDSDSLRLAHRDRRDWHGAGARPAGRASRRARASPWAARSSGAGSGCC